VQLVWAIRESHHYHYHTFQAKQALREVELSELEVSIRVLENDLWQRGVRIVDPLKEAVLYALAREEDEDFTTLISSHSAIASRWRVKRAAVLENVEYLKQAFIIHGRREKIRREYEAVMVEEAKE